MLNGEATPPLREHKHVRDGPALERGSHMAWIYLGLAGLLEIVWAYFLKQSAGFSRLVPSLITFVSMAGSFALLALAMRSLPLGTAYTIWTGIGAVGAFLVGVLILGEPANALRLTAAGFIVIGLVLMKMAS